MKKSESLTRKKLLMHQILERLADKWTLVVIEALHGKNDIRFSRLRDEIGNVSQKMLTKTLRQLERDGLVSRRVHATVPPRVDYHLTRLGNSLRNALCDFWTWVAKNMEDVERSRLSYEARNGKT